MAESTLRIATFNCRNFKSSIVEISQLCKDCDIILLQETWLMPHESDMLSTLSSDHYAKGVYAVDPSQKLIAGRPFGGLAILWRKSLGRFCSINTFDDPRIMGLQLRNDDIDILILNVYLPYFNGDNIDEYLFYLGKIDSLIEDSPAPYIYACGDFNADIREPSTFGKELIKFCDDSNLKMADVHYNSDQDRFTFYSEAHNSIHWLDHVVCTHSALTAIQSVQVEYSYVSSDHLPMKINVDLGKINLDANNVNEHTESLLYKVKWDKLTSDDLTYYTSLTDSYLEKVYIDHSLLLCNDSMCKDESHKSAIKHLYEDIVYGIDQASESFLQTMSHKPELFKQVMGWNELCKEAHSSARDAFLQWAYAGKPKQGFIFDTMKQTRARFKLILRKCRQQEASKSKDSLAKKLLGTDSKSFWKEVKTMNGSSNAPLSSTVGNAVGHKDIASMWHNHYKDLLNSSKDMSEKHYVLNQFNKVNSRNMSYNCIFSPGQIEKAIKGLKSGKAVGNDNLSAEHLKFCSKRVYCLLSMLYNCCVSHAYIPSDMLDTIIVPLPKDKKGDITDRDNYRPIALTTIMSKVLEGTILIVYDELLWTSPNLFGFKKGLSTDMSIFVLKQIIDHYRSLSSPIYLAFLDASKAFDKLNHWCLFRKLLDRGIPVIIVRLFHIWYTSQLYYVRWGSTLSSGFHVSNGVRQGSLISPIFFNIYVNDLSNVLNSKRCGCNLNGVNYNHLLYADDTILLAPSPSALQKLITICERFASNNEIIYNPNKSRIMCIQPNKDKVKVPVFTINGKNVMIVEQFKYLGFCISSDMKDDCDINRQIRSFYSRGNIVIKCFRHCSDEVKSLLFKTYCSNMYCSHLWSKYSIYSFRKLKTSFNRIFRMLFNLDRRASISHNMLLNNIRAFDVNIRKYILNFKNRLENCNNVLIQTLLDCWQYPNSLLFLEWKKQLYIL